MGVYYHDSLTSLLASLKLPPQDLAVLTCCHSYKPAKVRKWVESLSITEVSRTSAEFYQLLPEVCRLDVDPFTRLQLLEVIRPRLEQCLQVLSKGYLNQPLVLPEKALKTATVAQALQKHLSVGYLVTLRDLSIASKPLSFQSTSKNQLTAIHRALSSLSELLMRSFQLYIPAPPKIWLQVHALYQLAVSLQLHHEPITDPLHCYVQSTTLERTYLRALTLACSCTNQLRQQEMAILYQCLEEWSGFIKLEPIGSTRLDRSMSPLFIVDPSIDSGPLNSFRFSQKASAQCFYMKFDLLLLRLNDQGRESWVDKRFTLPGAVSQRLVDHLIQTWSGSYTRQAERQKSNGELMVTIGLTHLHQHLCGGESFEQLLEESLDQLEHTTFSLESEHSVKEALNSPVGTVSSNSAFTLDNPSLSAGERTQSLAIKKPLPPVYTTHIVDVSRGGYCLEWRLETAVKLHTGDLLGIKEKGSHDWGVGMVRWLQKKRNSTMLGIQLLAYHAKPYGAALDEESHENANFHRVLILPPSSSTRLPETVLAPSAPFQELDRVKLNLHGKEQMIQLTRQLFSSSSANQFSFRRWRSEK